MAAPGLSPSRAADYQQCPLLFRYRVVDQLPEPPSAAAARGSLVHRVLDGVFDLPAARRTPEAALALLGPAWQEMVTAEPALATLLEGDGALSAWLDGAGELVGTYFALEDPTRLEPAEREVWVRTTLDGGPALRGIVDRLDATPDGALRVVDYKTGRSPRRPEFYAKAFFQLRFYALVLWRSRGTVPRMLQIVYLGDGQVLREEPSQRQLEITESKVRSVWDAIQQSARTGTFLPQRGRLCDWCSFHAHCPEFGGTVPDLDPQRVEDALGVRPG